MILQADFAVSRKTNVGIITCISFEAGKIHYWVKDRVYSAGDITSIKKPIEYKFALEIGNKVIVDGDTGIIEGIAFEHGRARIYLVRLTKKGVVVRPSEEKLLETNN